MDDWLIAPTVGSILFVMGCMMMRSHVLSWQRQKHDPVLEDVDRKHYHARYRRRMQMSRLLVALGVLIPLGDPLLPRLIPQQNWPGLFAVYWSAVLLMLGWLIIVALGDMLATGAHSRASLARIHQKQRELENQIARIKSQRPNGHKLSE